MTDAYIVGAVRTPTGRRGGGLSAVHPADLAAHVLRALMDRTGADPAAVDEVVLGGADTAGPRAGNVARVAWLAAGLPEAVPGVTVDHGAGSGSRAVRFAAEAVRAGDAHLVVAGGVQNMSAVPAGTDEPSPAAGSRGWAARYRGKDTSEWRAAELVARRWELSRGDMEEYLIESHRRAVAATDEGRFAREIVPALGMRSDEVPRRDVTAEKLAAVAPRREGDRTTAALTAPPADAAAVVMIASREAVREHGLTARARLRHMSARGGDPAAPFAAPIPATVRALRAAGLTLDDIDVVEADEAYAPLAMAWLLETRADPRRVNPSGGALALGRPLGAHGARLLTSLLHELERVDGRYGLQVVSTGLDQAAVTIIERL
ncbi:acetyl-CoA C-acetyltransferase [Sphaerisporangium rubeum]|uniref:Acetyl-CoA C-acetyltransferase n=1 Tax=Sphaerisporangium rubeum TaxID=321317 RepID=A0A7X0IHD3_9ACTN|nr:acetyl-CoA C-acyltransferase [Sphaerisporangium rubeum]MBB6475201.1 acetyl-CoA C-acetyltransferase [Sphaerisporangium rubeum]